MLSTRIYWLVSAISGLLSVALGAFGAHGLKNLVFPDMLAVYQTGVQYHSIHTLVLLFISGVLLIPSLNSSATKVLKWAANLMIIGILLFSGSLYAMTLLSISGEFPNWLGPITPLGGLTFIIAWGLLAIAAFQLPIEDK